MSVSIEMSKYVSVLPKNKTSQYTPSERLEYELYPEHAFIDGKGSYWLVEVQNTSTFKDNSSVDAPYPCAPYAHLGAHAFIKNLKIDDLNGRQIENYEQYPHTVMMLKSHNMDDDEREVSAKVEGISGANPFPDKNVVSEAVANHTYLRPSFDTDISGNLVNTSSNVATSITSQYCVPLHTGSFSGLDMSHEVYPNMALKGSKLTFDLAPANQVLQTLSQRLFTDETTSTCYSGTYPLEFLVENEQPYALLSNAICNSNYQPIENLLYSKGQIVVMTAADTTTQKLEIKNVLFDQGDNDDNIMLEFVNNITLASGPVNLKLAEPNYNYIITKCELRLLTVIPDKETIKAVSKQVQNVGYNISSVQTNKLSRVANLKETILDLPLNFKRAMSILIAPVQSNDVNKSDWEVVDAGTGLFNSLSYPYFNLNTNISYQFQLRNILTPDRPIVYNSSDTVDSDNVLHWNNLSQALSHVCNVKCLGDSLFDQGVDYNIRAMSTPFFFPLKLCPVGNSLDLLNVEPQARIIVDDPSDCPNILYYIYTIHTRRIQSMENLPVSVDI